MMRKFTNMIILFCATLGSCQTKVPDFNGDRAFNHLVAQCDFGPRNPGSEGHKKALKYFLDIFTPLADTVFTQAYTETMPKTGQKVGMNNVIARFNPESNNQIMISAHWDTRPWGDRGESIMEKSRPILGANDGASGVAVLLELADRKSVV